MEKNGAISTDTPPGCNNGCGCKTAAARQLQIQFPTTPEEANRFDSDVLKKAAEVVCDASRSRQ